MEPLLNALKVKQFLLNIENAILQMLCCVMYVYVIDTENGMNTKIYKYRKQQQQRRPVLARLLGIASPWGCHLIILEIPQAQDDPLHGLEERLGAAPSLIGRIATRLCSVLSSLLSHFFFFPSGTSHTFSACTSTDFTPRENFGGASSEGCGGSLRSLLRFLIILFPEYFDVPESPHFKHVEAEHASARILWS